MIKYILAHDLGTSGNKATLFTTEGVLVDSAVHPYDVKWSHDVWAEQDADDWYIAVCETTKKILKKAKHGEVIGVSFSGQMMGCLCVDKQGIPLGNSIIWADMRATEEEAFIKSKFDEPSFYRLTGNKPSASNTLAKLLWVKNHRPDIYENTYKVLNAKDYIILKLTGEFVTDYSDASGTNLLDLNALAWSSEIADEVGIDLNMMPTLKQSIDVVGQVTKQGAQESGLKIGTPIICGGADGSMAAVGACCIEQGTAFSSVGTSAWNATTTNQPLYDPLMRTINFAHIIPGKFVPCGAMSTAGIAVSWIIQEIAHFEEILASKTDTTVYEIINDMIAKTEAGSKGLIFLPHLQGERSPRWNADARGTFIGLKMETGRREIFRSVYEGIAMNLEIVLGIINEKKDIKKLVLTGGGGHSKVWCQIFADVYNMEIHVPTHMDVATSVGAAVTAGVGLGVYENFDVIYDFVEMGDIFYPDQASVLIYDELKKIFNEAYESLVDVYKNLADFTRRQG